VGESWKQSIQKLRILWFIKDMANTPLVVMYSGCTTITPHESGISYPASLPPQEYSADCVEEVAAMEWQHYEQQHCFYIIDFIDFDGTGLEEHDIPLTF
jgi:hypothetical protein